MKVIVQPGNLTGDVQAPASKSSMQRACAAALLSHGITNILNPGHSNDDLAAKDVVSRLGAEIILDTPGELVIKSYGVNPSSDNINCGESGLGIRMFTPLAALSERELTINGTGSLLKRPMHFFDEVFPKVGIQIKSSDGHLPLTIKGPLRPATIEIDGSLSSQFLTGMLMAYAASSTTDVEIYVKDLKSKPYIDLTLDVLKKFGVDVENDRYQTFRFSRNNKGLTSTSYTVEGDWSGGAFLLVAGAIAGDITVKGLGRDSTQADKQIIQALTDAGASIRVMTNIIEVGRGDLKAFSFDATDCPDLFPPLVSLASFCEGTTYIRGVSRLEHKESNRGVTLQDEFRKMGVSIELDGDIMRVHGINEVNRATVHSRHDHRIAMACAVAALRADGDVVIEEAEAVEKSFPDFYEKLQQLGASIQITSNLPA
jgi:3-phosphoshikimate 1-carboxyvinyltransferase